MSTRTATGRVAVLLAVLTAGVAAPASAAPAPAPQAHPEWVHDAAAHQVLLGSTPTAPPDTDGIRRIWCEMTEDTVTVKIDLTNITRGFIWADFFYTSSFGPDLVRVTSPDHDWEGNIDRAWVEERALGQGFDITKPWRMWVQTDRGMFIEGEPCIP